MARPGMQKPFKRFKLWSPAKNDHSTNAKWESISITFDTTASWCSVVPPHKIDKDSLFETNGNFKGSGRRWYTTEGMQDEIFCRTNRARIVRAVEFCDASQLRKIAVIVLGDEFNDAG